MTVRGARERARTRDACDREDGYRGRPAAAAPRRRCRRMLLRHVLCPPDPYGAEMDCCIIKKT